MGLSRASNARRYTITNDRGTRLVQFGDMRADWFGTYTGQAALDRIDRLAVDEETPEYGFGSIRRVKDPVLKEIARVHTTGSCGCCGADRGGETVILKAGVQDSDGTYYARLCESCFDDFEDAAEFDRPRGNALNTLTELLGDDTDGIQSNLEDLAYAMPLDEFASLETPSRQASYTL